MAWPLIIAAIASSAIQRRNQNKTAKRQDKAAAQSLRNQAEFQRKANARTDEQINNLEKSGPEDEFRQRSGDIRKQLRLKQSMALAGLQQNAGASDAFNSGADTAGGTAVGYGDDINKWLSGIDAPGLQRQGEAFERADVENSLNTLRRNSAQEQNLLRLRQAGIRDNPLLSMLSTGLSAYGAAGVGRGSGSMAQSGGLGSQFIPPSTGSISAAGNANMPWNKPIYPGYNIGPFGSGS
jgi:hypothetical protein